MSEQIVKSFATDDHDELIAAADQPMVTTFRRSDAMTKSASEAFSRQDLQDHMPPDGFIGVHAIAMGAEEDYGCVSADTLIAMADGSHAPMWSVEVGDHVLSGNGEIRQVLHKFEYPLDAALKIRVGGLSSDIVVSPNHPFMALKKGAVTCKRDRHKRCLPPTFGKQNICQRGEGCDVATADYAQPRPEYVTAENLTPGDFLTFKIPSVTPLEAISHDEATIIGLWLAEGSIAGRGRSCLQFSFGAVERDTYVAELVAAAEREGWTVRVFGPYDHRPTELTVTLTGRPDRARTYEQWFGAGASCKRIPHWFHGLPREIIAEMLRAYIGGDGALTDPAQVCITTASASLAANIQSLLWNVGVEATSFQYRATAVRAASGLFVGYRVNYAVSRVPDDLAALRFGHIADLAQTTKVHLFKVGDVVYLPIRAVEEIEWNSSIYTLEVEQDHSYVSAGVWSKNSNRNGDAASRKALRQYHKTFEKYAHAYREHKHSHPRLSIGPLVKLARYNEAQHRVELLFWLDERKAPDLCKSAAEGKELSWSMSMRLPFDRCSCCDHKSRSPKFYCGHLKKAMLKYVPEFRKYAYARNEDDVKFFDISAVKRRADRIAASLRYLLPEGVKAASADDLGVISGAEWASIKHAHDPAWLTPWELRTVEKIAAMKHYPLDAAAKSYEAVLVPRDLSAEQIRVLADADFRYVAGALCKRAMILPFATFASMVTGETVEDLRKSASFRFIENVGLGSLLDDMTSLGGCCCGPEVAAEVTPDEFFARKPVTDGIDQMIAQVGDDLGLTPKAINNRSMTTIIIKAAAQSQPGTDETVVEPLHQALRDAYGYYLAKSAHSIADHPHVDARLVYRGIAAMLNITT